MSGADRSRLLFVSYDSTISSANVAMRNLMQWLCGGCRQVTFAARNDGPIAQLARADGVNVRIAPRLFERSELDRLCGEHDVVIANTTGASPAIEAARRAQKRAICWLHEPSRRTNIAGVSDADLLLAPTFYTASTYTGVTDVRIERLPYGTPALAKPRSGANATVEFVCLANFEAARGQDILLDAVARLPDRIRDRARFTLVGRNVDATFASALRTKADALQNVAVRDAVTHREAVRLLQRADVSLFPARESTLPISAVEAAAIGTAIITSSIDGVCEWFVDELNALVIAPDDPHELANAIERCTRDAQLRVELAATAQRTFERHFAIHRIGTTFEQFVASLPERRKRPRSWSYSEWLACYGENEERASRLRRQVRRLHRQPRISIVMPVYNPDLSLLEAAIASVRTQIYANWELCIADDASSDAAVRPFLASAAERDARIKFVRRESNGHIAAASNSALAVATGEWIALLDQDDVLSPEALAHVAVEIDNHPAAALIYTDEDKLNQRGTRESPYFKSDWNPELFLAQNFINHLGVYRADLVRAVGGFREGYEGSQDYDLALRCIERLDGSQIRHIPRVLYHWRMARGSVAAVVGAKPYAIDAARRALRDHLARKGVAARVEECLDETESHRVHYDIAGSEPLVSIVIPTRNQLQLLRRTTDGLRSATDYRATEIIVVDNRSDDADTLAYLAQLETEGAARVVRDDEPFNFSRLINRGAAAAHGDLLLLLNNDVEVENGDWLREMVSHAVRPPVGAVGARLWYSDGKLQHGGVIVGLGGVAGHASYRVPRGHSGYFGRAILQQNCTAVTGACLLVRKALFDEVGGFNEGSLGINFNDVDFCLELRRRGYENVWTPYANLIHHESASRGHQASSAEQAQFLREANFMQRKWGDTLLSDPYYSPNLSLSWPGFELAFPPRVDAI